MSSIHTLGYLPKLFCDETTVFTCLIFVQDPEESKRCFHDAMKEFRDGQHLFALKVVDPWVLISIDVIVVTGDRFTLP